ncbi:MAG: gliding motility-associated C-terminal domain-containing protein [Ferruginibacter sp.]|nr:gliding motility-associated C-terminal domain-containing protein [Ferruginibacter sp.]
MKKIFLLQIILCLSFYFTTAQNCTNWLYIPTQPGYADIGNLNIPGNKLTIEANINRTSFYANGQATTADVVSKHSSPSDANYALRTNHCEITTSNGFFSTPYPCDMDSNKTYHVAMVYDGNSLKYYRNGFMMVSVPASGNLVQNNLKTYIGWLSLQNHNENFIGYINEVRFWNVARTQSELRTYMNISLPGPSTQAGLLAYYTFDNLLNKQGNAAYNGVLGGSAAINQTNTNCTFVADSCKTIPANNPCTFDFSYKQDICNPLSVQFNHIGKTPVNPYWSFGDGITVTGNAAPAHLYTAIGNYIVQYSIQNGACTDTISKSISVKILSEDIIITPDTTICLKATKQLRTLPALNFCWSPTIYLSDPNSPNPVTSTPENITYFFTSEVAGGNLIANGDFNSGNTGFSSEYNFANPNITEGQYFIGTNPQAWNAGLSVCTDHTTGNGNMMLVNGSPAPDVKVWTQSVAVIPNTNYAFSTWIQALYPPNPAQLSFSINGGNLGNLITASLPTCTWKQFYTTWNSGNNTTAIISIVNKNTFVQGNDFALDDISFAPVLIKRDSVKITIDTPQVKTIADTAICPGKPVQLNATGAVNYNWLPVTSLNNAGIANPVATPGDTTEYIVTGINARGCSANDTLNIFTKPAPMVTKSVDSTICKSLPVQLLAGGGTSYSWSPIATLDNPAIATPVASPTGNTTYLVTVTGANNCTTTDSIKIGIHPLPNFNISTDQATCVTRNVVLSAGGGNTYLWSPAALVDNPGISNPLTNITVTTSFIVTITEPTCNYSATLGTTVTVSPPPSVKVFKSNNIDCVFSNAQLTASGADKYVWSPQTGLNNGNIFNPLASIAQQYLVTGTDTITNCTGTAAITVTTVPPFDPAFFVPNAFSPNGDGLNDCFKVKHFGTVKSVDISIFNRMGNLIFHTLNVSDCWDGTYKGSPSDPGNYVYLIKTFNECGENMRKGNLILVR